MTYTLCGNKIELHRPSTGAVLVIGGFHGDEPQGIYFIRKYLTQNPNTKLMLIPCLNPDGVKENTRTNSNGVDLNRNFPSNNWMLSEKNEYYGGEKPASEIETKFLIEVIERYSPKAILSFHAPYKVVNYDGDENAKELALRISEIIGYPIEENIGYPTPGSFGTWAGIERKIPVITLELDENIELNELEKPVFDILEMLENY